MSRNSPTARPSTRSSPSLPPSSDNHAHSPLPPSLPPPQSGGWTLHWQGAFDESEFSYGATLYQELSLHPSLPPALGVKVVWEEVPTEGGVEGADVIVACVGEGAYAEKPGDIDDMDLPAWQVGREGGREGRGDREGWFDALYKTDSSYL